MLGGMSSSPRPARRYPTDLTDAQWALIAPLLPPPKSGPAGGRLRAPRLSVQITWISSRGSGHALCSEAAKERLLALVWWCASTRNTLPHVEFLVNSRSPTRIRPAPTPSAPRFHLSPPRPPRPARLRRGQAPKSRKLYTQACSV